MPKYQVIRIYEVDTDGMTEEEFITRVANEHLYQLDEALEDQTIRGACLMATEFYDGGDLTNFVHYPRDAAVVTKVDETPPPSHYDGNECTIPNCSCRQHNHDLFCSRQVYHIVPEECG